MTHNIVLKHIPRRD